MTLAKAQLEALTKDSQTPEEMSALYAQMLQHMINRSLDAELTAHLGGDIDLPRSAWEQAQWAKLEACSEPFPPSDDRDAALP